MTYPATMDMDAMLDEVLDELDDDDDVDGSEKCKDDNGRKDGTDAAGNSASGTNVQENAGSNDVSIAPAEKASAPTVGTNNHRRNEDRELNTTTTTADVPNSGTSHGSPLSPAETFQRMLRGFIEADGGDDDVVDGNQEYTGGIDKDEERLGLFMEQVESQLLDVATKAKSSGPTKRSTTTESAPPPTKQQVGGTKSGTDRDVGDDSDNHVDRTIAAILHEMAKANIQDPVLPPGTGTNAVSDEEKLLHDIFRSLAAGGGGDTTAEVEGLDGIGLDGDIPAGFNPDSFVDGMMEQLLSKELMYEPMKQVTEKFPSWLEKHKDTLAKDEWEQRKQQYECFRRLVEVYESSPSSTDGDKAQTDRLMELMQQVQEFGQPPAEIVNEIAPGLELDDDGLPKMSGLPFAGGEDGECCVM